ncbi:MAG: hypothetical protein GX593_03695 [Actinomycetales bacterium]|nr:hypothetical protein [Actinomycetales bacterium]
MTEQHGHDDCDEPKPSTPPTGSAREVLDLLAEGVPMALIADLADPAGPPSPVILEEEGSPDEAWWVPDYVPTEDQSWAEEVADDDDHLDRDA